MMRHNEAAQGPKFRVGELEGEPVPLKEGEVVEFGICKDRAVHEEVQNGR